METNASFLFIRFTAVYQEGECGEKEVLSRIHGFRGSRRKSKESPSCPSCHDQVGAPGGLRGPHWWPRVQLNVAVDQQ